MTRPIATPARSMDDCDTLVICYDSDDDKFIADGGMMAKAQANHCHHEDSQAKIEGHEMEPLLHAPTMVLPGDAKTPVTEPLCISEDEDVPDGSTPVEEQALPGTIVMETAAGPKEMRHPEAEPFEDKGPEATPLEELPPVPRLKACVSPHYAL